MSKKFWEFRNSADGSAELLLYGDISESSWYGDEVTPRQFKRDMDELGSVNDITVRINSGGGDVFAATAIGNLLETCSANVTAVIDGLCASAATIIACHCNKVVASNDSTYMIHPVSIGLCGYMTADKLNEYIKAIEAIRESIVSLYAKKTGRDKDEVAALMDATSWWPASEAKENGFVDELTNDEADTIVENKDGLLFVNSVNMNIPFSNAPKFVQDSLKHIPAAGGFVNKTTPADVLGDDSTKEVDEMDIKTIDDLRNAFPELCTQIAEQAATNATSTERQRIHDIMDMRLAGSEEIANDAMFTNPTSASDFAKAVVKNMKEKGNTYLDGVKNDANNGGVNGVNSTPPEDTNEDDFMDAIRRANHVK